jgi:hypothetical protein
MMGHHQGKTMIDDVAIFVRRILFFVGTRDAISLGLRDGLDLGQDLEYPLEWP